MRSRLEKRITMAFLIFFVCLAALIARLGYIQLERGNELSLAAMAHNTRMVAGEDQVRGDILDRNGVPLTGAYTANRVAVFPSAIADAGDCAQKLAGIFQKQPSFFEQYLKGGPCLLPLDISPEQLSRLKEMTGEGIAVLPVEFRYGPDPLAVHVTGHLNSFTSARLFQKLDSASPKDYNFNDRVGVMGLEKHYEQYLKGEVPRRQAYIPVDARGRLLAREPLIISGQEDKERYDVVTTIDRRVQSIVEDVLDQSVDKGAAVVMKKGSSEILACASRPDFNPELPASVTKSKENSAKVFLNRALSYYQPGSLFKIVLACAALEEEQADTETMFMCKGAGDEPVRCWKPAGHGEISLYGAVVNSCNPAFVQLGNRLGPDMIIEYARKLGLDEDSITGLPYQVNTRQDWSAVSQPYNLANSSVGQGPVLVTPVQVTSMMNVIASGGVYYQPRIVKELISPSSRVPFPSPGPSRVISQSTAGTMQKMLEGVTGQGVGSKAATEPYKSAGKTGSAQVSPGGGDINAWFSGYVSAENPEYIITVLVEDGESGGETAAPVFKNIAERLMQNHT